MLHSYNSYTIILESKAREKKINKVKTKIEKFIGIPFIIDWAIDKCISDRSTEGIQYAVFIANKMKEVVVEQVASIAYVSWNNGEKDAVDENIIRERVEKFIKTGKDDELVEILKPDWGNIEDIMRNSIEDVNEHINYVLDWLKNPLRDEKVNLSNLKFEVALKKSEEWHDSLKATGKITDESGEIFIEFDDGSYWIDLQTTYSRAEADAMGHCGNTNDGDTLLSYRDKDKSPHVTVAYDSKDGAIYQMKGRNNKKPVEKYHPFIYRLLVDPAINPKYFAYEYLKEEDFNMSDFDKETFQKVFNYRPSLVYESIQYDNSMCRGLAEKKYLSKEDIREVLENIEDPGNTFFDIIDSDLYSSEEIKEMYKTSGTDLNDFGELPKIMLFNRKIITQEEFVSYFGELDIDDGKITISADEDQLEVFMSDLVQTILFRDDPFDHWHESYYKMDSASDVWSKLTKKIKEEVIKKMIGGEISYNHWRDEERSFDDVEITKDMFKWVDNDYYLFINGEKYEIDKVLDESKDELDVYDALSLAQNEAQTSADQDEYYNRAKSALESKLTSYKREDRSVTNIDGKKRYYTVFAFDFHALFCGGTSDLKPIEDELRAQYTYNGTVDYTNESYSDFWSILDTFDGESGKADFDDNYGIYGDIDKDTLNDAVLYRLDEI